DTIEPAWRAYESKITRQLLWAPATTGATRPVESDRSLYVRFDTSNIRALQADRLNGAIIAERLKSDASQNERRSLVGLEPSPHPDADTIPEPVITAETFSAGSTDTAQAVDSVNSLQAASVTSALDVLTRLGEGTITPIIAVELLVALGIARDAAQRM